MCGRLAQPACMWVPTEHSQVSSPPVVFLANRTYTRPFRHSTINPAAGIPMRACSCTWPAWLAACCCACGCCRWAFAGWASGKPAPAAQPLCWRLRLMPERRCGPPACKPRRRRHRRRQSSSPCWHLPVPLTWRRRQPGWRQVELSFACAASPSGEIVRGVARRLLQQAGALRGGSGCRAGVGLEWCGGSFLCEARKLGRWAGVAFKLLALAPPHALAANCSWALCSR